MRCHLLACALILGTSCVADAAIQSVWSRTYDSPQWDAPVALARDSQSHVSIVVDSWGELAVLKYSASGTALNGSRWVRGEEGCVIGLVTLLSSTQGDGGRRGTTLARLRNLQASGRLRNTAHGYQAPPDALDGPFPALVAGRVGPPCRAGSASSCSWSC